MKGDKISIEEIVNHDTVDFERGYSIIQDRIPFEERSDVLDFISSVNQARRGELSPDSYHMLVARYDGDVIGVITGYYLSDINCGFINTLAVKIGLEGKNVGTNLRNELIGRFRRDSNKIGNESLNGVLGEIEEKNPWLKKIVSNPRVFPFDIKYIQPPLRVDKTGRELVLYLEPDEEIKTIGRDKAVRIVSAIYRNIYDIEEPEKHHCFKEILKSFESRKYISRKAIN